jgi:peptidoglycan hydrolase-like protein with peptidoglycan-binding domain
MPTIKVRASGPAVNRLQAALKAAGFDRGTIDGHFGKATLAQLKAFQKAHRLPADGAAGPLAEGELADARAAVNGGTHGLPAFEAAYRRGKRLFPAP